MEQLAEHARCGRSSTVLDAVSLSLTEGAAAPGCSYTYRAFTTVSGTCNCWIDPNGRPTVRDSVSGGPFDSAP
jgi:hypothetical protein